VGFTVLYVLRDIMAGTPRNLVLLIEPTCTTQADPSLLRESVRMRALVRSKAEAEARKTGIHLVDTLDEMMAVAERLLTHKTLSP